MGDHHDDDFDGVADHGQGCEGENRDDPDSWGDPEILEAWQSPEEVTL